MSDNLSQSAAYLAAWIESKGRFDVDALCDDMKIHEDLEYIRAYVVEFLRDAEVIQDISYDRHLSSDPDKRWI